VACIGGALLFAFGADTQAFAASDGSTGSAACASVWTHWFHSDQYVNTSVSWQIRDVSNDSDEVNFPIIVAANDACRGSVSAHQTFTLLLLLIGMGAGVTAVAQKRRTLSN
jgi:hypothetical protein